MPMAANHLIGVDIDPRNGGYLTMEQIEAEHGPLVSRFFNSLVVAASIAFSARRKMHLPRQAWRWNRPKAQRLSDR